MRAQTITTISKSKRRLRRRGIAIALAACALAVPASAAASPVDPVIATVSDSDQLTNTASDSDYTSLTALSPSPNGPPGSEIVGHGHTALNGPTGGELPDPTPVSGSATSDGDSFDWGIAALGAGGALALVAVAIGALGARNGRMQPSPSA